MKEMNEDVAKRIEELGLDKNDPQSIDIAMDSLENDKYRVGEWGMNRKRDFESTGFDLSEENANCLNSAVLNSPKTEESGIFNQDELSYYEALWLDGMDNGRKHGFNNSFDLYVPPNVDVDSGNHSRAHTQLNLNWRLGLSGDRKDIGEGSSRRVTQEQNRNGLNMAIARPPAMNLINERQIVDVDSGNHSRANTQLIFPLGLRLSEGSSRQNTQDGNRNGVNMAIARPPAMNLINERQIAMAYRYPYDQELIMKYARPTENPKSQQSAHLTSSAIPTDEAKVLGKSGGDFSEALKKVRARTYITQGDQLIKRTPQTEIQDNGVDSLFVPSLLELSLKVLAQNANYIASLDQVPYHLRKKLIDRLCDTRRMDLDTFNLLIQGCPSEVRVKNCSWLTDDQFEQSFQSWQTKHLRVLQLDLGGQIMFDYVFKNKLDQSRPGFSRLVVISLRGALRLTDLGVKVLVMSAPALLSINLGHCSLITFMAIEHIADNLGKILKELYIDRCGSINAMQVKHCIKKFEKLELFSIAGLEGVSDGFIRELVRKCGKRLMELDLAGCLELTDSSLLDIAINCPSILALNISELFKLTDVGMEYLANGCRLIQRLNLARTKFSDEVISAFLEISGASLTELTLNSVSQVGLNTAMSIAEKSKDLSYLDISFCRKISSSALGCIVDNCLSLRLLKVFGCKQIDSTYLHGLSKSRVGVVGFGLMPVLDHIILLEPDHDIYLRYSPLTTPEDSGSN